MIYLQVGLERFETIKITATLPAHLHGVLR